MSYGSGVIMSWSSKFEMPSMTYGRYYYSQYPGDNYPLDWDLYRTGVDDPVAGSTLDFGAIQVHYIPKYYAQFVTPYKCRLTSISWALDMANPANGSDGVKFAAFKGVFTDEETRATTGTWLTVLGVATTTTMSGDPAAQVQKGTTTFNSSNGDVSAGDSVGITITAVDAGGSAGAGILTGVVTCTFETL